MQKKKGKGKKNDEQGKRRVGGRETQKRPKKRVERRGEKNKSFHEKKRDKKRSGGGETKNFPFKKKTAEGGGREWKKRGWVCVWNER